MLFCITLFIGITTITLPKLIPRIISNYLFVVTLSAISFIIILVFVTVYNLNENPSIIPYWAINPFSGIAFGVMHISTEMCILELQPKQHAGKVNGIKEAINVICRIPAIFFVGLFWDDTDGNSCWIGAMICCIIVLILSFANCWFARFVTL